MFCKQDNARNVIKQSEYLSENSYEWEICMLKKNIN